MPEIIQAKMMKEIAKASTIKKTPLEIAFLEVDKFQESIQNKFYDSYQVSSRLKVSKNKFPDIVHEIIKKLGFETMQADFQDHLDLEVYWSKGNMVLKKHYQELLLDTKNSHWVTAEEMHNRFNASREHYEAEMIMEIQRKIMKNSHENTIGIPVRCELVAKNIAAKFKKAGYKVKVFRDKMIISW